MIFVTVGNMLPFDRLIEAVDRWAAQESSVENVFAQIGKGTYQPRHCEATQFLSPTEYRDKFAKARFVVAHAGMGTIISALELQKPVVILPRHEEKGEHFNQHQLATVRHFRKSNLIMVAETEAEIPRLMDRALAYTSASETAMRSGAVSNDWPADPELIDFVRDFIMKT